MTASPTDIEKIKGWRKLANNYQDDQFIQFALEYFAFNALVKTYFLTDKSFATDRTLIDTFKDEKNCLNYILTDKSAWILKLKEELDKEPLRNHTRKNNSEVKIESVTDWSNIIEAVYVMRNNLFHGEKWSERSRDQNLVEMGYHLLTGFNDYLLNKI